MLSSLYLFVFTSDVRDNESFAWFCLEGKIAINVGHCARCSRPFHLYRGTNNWFAMIVSDGTAYAVSLGESPSTCKQEHTN